MRRPNSRELYIARELAEVVLLDAVLATLAHVVAFEHPCLDDPCFDDPPSLLAARRLAQAIHVMRAELRRYRAEALDRHHPQQTDLPF